MSDFKSAKAETKKATPEILEQLAKINEQWMHGDVAGDKDEDFCRSYSLTNAEVKKMSEWQIEHDKKYHKKGYGYQGAIGCSRYITYFVTTSIGVGAYCKCEKCSEDNEIVEKVEKKIKKIEEKRNKVKHDDKFQEKWAASVKEVEKERERYEIELRGIDE